MINSQIIDNYIVKYIEKSLLHEARIFNEDRYFIKKIMKIGRLGSIEYDSKRPHYSANAFVEAENENNEVVYFVIHFSLESDHDIRSMQELQSCKIKERSFYQMKGSLEEIKHALEIEDRDVNSKAIKAKVEDHKE